MPGSVHGTVTLRRGPGREIADDPSGVVVYVPDFRGPAPKKPVRLPQRGGAFRDEIVPLVAGSTVEFPNQDPYYHAVFSRSGPRPFDLGLVAPGDTARVRFDAVGLIQVYCNIHPGMAAYLLVLANAAFALTDEDGEFTLVGVPPGRHKLVAWTPRARPLVTIVDVPAGGQVTLDLVVDETLNIGGHPNKFGVDYPPVSGGN